ncbi:ribosome maturation factor RimP [Clostridium sp. D2Q-11]|uniref:Ribosome maturation factor RimP n=1 Tax=Anaeromonas frigoriresistens TaxID=2683708 RepID=A0A942Z8K6_9FIRM|nr:ribosome maturation factor RimP [Anaeromonas frigoriresistens]MBS4539887.1 ribosome maturation factor RimP [Anaeromonas frigoriresistens]
MLKKEVEELVFNLVEPITDSKEFELVDVEYVKEGPYMYLRVFIDKPGGVTIDDCQSISQLTSEKLDEIDPVEENYFLEVSSPGIDRPFKNDKDYKRALEKDVEVSLYKQINNSKNYTGQLIDFNENDISLDVEGEIIKLNRNDIAKINLAIKF